jgi:hypothetical protein
MPYIKQADRNEVNGHLENLINFLEKEKKGAQNADIDGILNYTISKMLIEVYSKKPSYSNYNRMMGVIECVKQELYRRVVAPYEDKKIKENGDII